MPAFKIQRKESEQVDTATFRKKADYKVVTLNDDVLKRPRLLHKIQAEKLIKLKLATEVKDADISEAEPKVTIKKSNKKVATIN